GERTVPNITTGFNHEEFAGNIAGIAHWVVLDHAQMTSWNLQVGATARMEPGWVRIYYPGFEPNHPRNEALHRPYTNPTDETQQFEDYHGIHYGAEAFQRFIKKHLCTYIRHAILDRGFVPSISEVRNRRIQQERADSPADAQALDLYNKEIEQLRRQIEELNLLLQASEEEKALLARQKEEEAGKLHQEIAQLRGRLIALNTKRASEPVSEWRDMVPPEEECTWERLVDWVNTELAGRLILLPRTHKMIREAEYENPRLAYEALALLAGPYRDMNLGSKRDQARKQWENGLSSLHLAEEPSLGESKKGGNNAEDYRVKYEDKNFLLERHLKKGNSWERRYCFRVYYCFDDREEHKVVLVGGIPHHLSTDYS
ncbi:MAG TPA: hypothetical protein PLX03_13015, partial [Candidatus Hydrogenedentes bacterium]|nr:hypothetical protein [Candidatus Hydrogenedentota bacterium]